MRKELIFDGIINFSAFINPLVDLKQKVPQLEVLCNLGQSLTRGCRCNKQKRKEHAEKAYENILNYLSEEDVNTLKSELNTEKVIFKLDKIIILEK
jgi:hypothetical protein